MPVDVLILKVGAPLVAVISHVHFSEASNAVLIVLDTGDAVVLENVGMIVSPQ